MVHKLLIKLINIVTSIPKCLFHPFPITYKLIQNYSNNPFDFIIFPPDRIPTNIFLLPNFFPSPFFSSLTQFTNLLLPLSSHSFPFYNFYSELFSLLGHRLLDVSPPSSVSRLRVPVSDSLVVAAHKGLSSRFTRKAEVKFLRAANVVILPRTPSPSRIPTRRVVKPQKPEF